MHPKRVRLCDLEAQLDPVPVHHVLAQGDNKSAPVLSVPLDPSTLPSRTDRHPTSPNGSRAGLIHTSMPAPSAELIRLSSVQQRTDQCRQMPETVGNRAAGVDAPFLGGPPRNGLILLPSS
jgi:hypothetical protein